MFMFIQVPGPANSNKSLPVASLGDGVDSGYKQERKEQLVCRLCQPVTEMKKDKVERKGLDILGC